MRLVIIGGGISGLSLAYFLLERKPFFDIIVLESEKKAGGKIWTEKINGFLCEGGVNGFLDNRPKTLDLVAKLGLEPLRSNDNARKRYIFSGGRLHLLPESPVSFLTSGLLSLPGRLRVLGEIFVPKGATDEETLADFARRRLGREAYEKLIDPMASGIYAGDPENMSVKSCFRRVYELEKKYGSLIKAMITLQKEAKKTGEKVGAGPGGVLTSFFEGMQTIIAALKDRLGERVKTGSRVIAVDKKDDNYTVYTSGGLQIEADAVVCAAPAHEAAVVLKSLNENLSSVLNEIPYPAVSVICMGYRRTKIERSLDGFGFLIPNRENRKILGTLWDSSIFPNRAPEDHVLLRSMLGGARMSELALKDENALINLVMDELRYILNVRTDPDFFKVYTHKKGIPQYTRGHERRLDRISEIVKGFRNFYITGNAYSGIGVNDCIENSYKLAGQILEGAN